MSTAGVLAVGGADILQCSVPASIEAATNGPAVSTDHLRVGPCPVLPPRVLPRAIRADVVQLTEHVDSQVHDEYTDFGHSVRIEFNPRDCIGSIAIDMRNHTCEESLRGYLAPVCRELVCLRLSVE